ncbi:unnamed protein product [Hermetia illucens]|uniref:Peptidase M12B domain-containing protein n=1 Tax=Hermetia illucens TaxID=343691 RepID=A0A7R8UUW0_HERIL|nr:A disintegrin and metalloproteinase with thrombospondin motifs 12 isoform X2 [Hermetia illucens]CAD7087043.1 unnamed protein product [Hermetia illucens]
MAVSKRVCRFAICLWVCCSCWALGDLPPRGKYTHNISTGHLVIPRKVDHKGQHISHNLTHHHDIHGKDLHYHIEVGNETLHLELEPHNYFMAPGLIVERHKREIRTRKRPSRHVNCHYHGKVRGQEGSRVALSACNGIAAHLRTHNGDYFVEPSKHHEYSEGDGHPHVVFHRSAVQTKKKRKGRHKKRQQHISNCGTKEPRRRTETKIEWQPQGKVFIQRGRKIRRHQNAQTHNNHMNHHKDGGASANSRQQHRRRTKRSISSPRHVEALIVVDSSMVAFHDDAEQYMLTIMNMVSSLYKDPSIGNSIQIVIVRIILIEDEEAHPDLNLTENAQRNLQMFCSWQHKLNRDSENDPQHHDVGILVTRRNICGNDCLTLGLANVGGMCKPRKSCSVNEDNGIMLSHTIAHELGHNFGMYHDTAKIGCHGREGPIVHIMTPTFGADTVQVAWSNCSRKYITHFLDQGLGRCLDNAPTQHVPFEYADLPPGALYKAERQCQLQFNLTEEEVTVCSSQHEICSQLWCQVNDECVTNMRPTAPGTNCGKHKWCQNGKCVPIEEKTPVNGGWGNWSDWSTCSRSCGGGISMQLRECNNPSPANGGTFCIGERKRYVVCNTEPCPDGEPSFRAEQCSHFNNETYDGQKYKWLPYFDRYNPCKLYCTDEEDQVIANWADIVADGTPCKIGTKNMCIDGICRKVGCDWIVDSKKEEDRCGICEGNDENCEIIKEEYKTDFDIIDGYVEIATIPKGARHILIEEMTNSENFLSIGKTNTSEFYLNGERLISMPGEFIIADAESLYDKEENQELIKIPGPIMHTISIFVIVRGSAQNNGIRYEFIPPAKNSTSVRTYEWKLGDWTACSATCGGGVQYRMPLCFNNGKLSSDEDECWSNAENERPKQIVRECNLDPCPAHWWIGPWQLCPVTCKKKGAPDPVKRRSIICLDQNEIVLPDSRCEVEKKPIDTEKCGANIPLCETDDEDIDLNSEGDIVEEVDMTNAIASSKQSNFEFDNMF